MSSSVFGVVLRMHLHAPEAEWAGLYNRIQVWRSLLGPNGPFEELTAAAATGAIVPRFVPPVDVAGKAETISGKTLSVLLDEQEQVDVTFTGSDPIYRDVLADQVRQYSSSKLSAYLTETGAFVVRREFPGQGSMRILPSEAAAILGLPTTEPECIGFGRPARIALVSGKEDYLFIDHHGAPDAYYCTRYSNAQQGDRFSEFSLPFSGKSLPALADGSTVVAYLDVIDAMGRPVQNQQVGISSSFTGTTAQGRVVAGTDQTFLTDADGHVEFPLVRGSNVRVVLFGTALAREVTVPVDPGVLRFNLFSEDVGRDDLFRVQVPNLDFAVRSN